MKQPGVRKPMRPAGIFVSLADSDVAPIVCAALVLASFTVLFRIVSIW